MARIYRNGRAYGDGITNPNAADVTFVPGDSGMTATNVNAAIIEAFNSGGDSKIDGQITSITIGTNPTGNVPALVINWRNNNGNHTNYINFSS